MADQGRPPFRDMQGLLNFALRGTAAEDVNLHSVTPMDSERRQWLEEALKNLSVDFVEELTKSLQALSSEGISDPAQDPEPFEKALDTVTDIAEQIDMANDFHKIGGFSIFPRCLSSPHPGVRWRTGHLIATLTQNNPYCQKHVVEAGLFPTLLSKIEDDDNETVRVKCLYALGCLTRSCPEAQKELEKHDGFSVLLRTLQTSSEKLRTKAAFLLTSLCRDSPQFRDTVCKMGFVEQIVGLLYNEADSTHEHLLSALLSLAREHKPARSECRREALGLEQILTEKIQECKQEEARQEEAEYCRELLDICFNHEVTEDR